MKSKTCMMLITMAMLGLVSCASLSSLSSMLTPDSKKQAHERWSQMRGQLKHRLAAERFATGNFDKAQEHLDEAIALDPSAPANYVLQAKLYLERGEMASAAGVLEKALENGGDIATIDYLRGVIAERYRRFDEALEWYKRASSRSPTNAHYVAAVAETMVALDRPTDALALVRERWTDFEQNATLRSIAGGIHMMLGQYEEAAEAYGEAARISSDDVLLQLQLGQALAMLGKYGEARPVLEMACAKAEEVPPSALIALGRCHMALNQPEDALEVFQRVAKAVPNDPRGWSWLSRAALVSGDLLTARRAAGRTMELDPTHSDNTMMLGYVCWRQHDFSAATTAFEKVLHDSPDDQIARHMLARMQARGKARAP